MESKTKTADLSVRAAFALFQGAILAMAYPLFYFVFPVLVRTYPLLFLFVVIPALSFLTSLFINLFLQYMYCGSTNINSTSMAASISPLSTVVLGGLSYFLPFIRLPISQLFPELPQESLEEAKFARDIWGYSFYLFWAGVYGQTIGSGMIAACP